MTLSDFKVGQNLKIVSFVEDEIVIKLMEMGCIPGEFVTIENKAAFGDPISITVSGYHLSLRKSEAEKIIVEEIFT